MKKYILIFFIWGCCHCLTGQTNTYFQHNENWTIETRNIEHCADNSVIFSGADTVILSQTFKKIYWLFGSTCGGPPVFQGSLTTPTRLYQDSIGLVNLYSIDTLTNSILDTATIDFSRTDSIIFKTFWSTNTQGVAIQLIDTVYFNSTPKKWFYTDYGKVLEGTFDGYGSPFVFDFPDFETYHHVICYSLSDSIFRVEQPWWDPYTSFWAFGNCTYINTVQLESMQNEPSEIFPNPATEHLFFLNEQKVNQKIGIINSIGQKISIPIIDNNSITISYLSPGIYFLEINTGTNIIYRKFIKE